MRKLIVILNAMLRDGAADRHRSPAVWRWERRFAQAGVEGLLRDATRKSGKAPLADATVRRVVALTCAERPGEATHWTGRAMAKAAGISLRSVQRIWAAHDLTTRDVLVKLHWVLCYTTKVILAMID
jgi:hypothetical protein